MTPSLTSSPARERVLDAADSLLGRFGYQKTTLDDLAREAGIGRRSIYLHFRNKEEVFLSSIDRVVERMTVELARIGAGDGSPADRLREMLVARVMHRFDSVRGYYRSLDEMLASLRPAYLERRSRYFDREAEVLSQVIEEGARAGSFRAPDPLTLARTLVLATNGLLPYSLSARELGSRRTVAAEADRIAELLLAGLNTPRGNTRGRSALRPGRSNRRNSHN